MKKLIVNFISCLLLFFIACGDKDKNGKKLSTPNSGDLTISTDETFRSILEAEEEVFETIYSKTHLTIHYKPELNVMEDFLNDSSSLIIVCRELTEDEKAYFKEIKITTRASKIASDAIALIINKANTDSNITVSQIKEILKGNIKSWNDLNARSIKGDLKLVFDNKNSSTVRYLGELAGLKKIESPVVSALNSNKEVIDFVNTNSNAIGVIGVNWISDSDDSNTVAFMKNMRVMAVKGDPGTKGEHDYYQPYQAYIATGEYPLIRSVYSISREPRAGLATGFASFLASDKGQRIILKSGLLPATAPIRIVQFNQ
jgi:phosphate transport system substrate-binding protein